MKNQTTLSQLVIGKYERLKTNKQTNKQTKQKQKTKTNKQKQTNKQTNPTSTTKTKKQNRTTLGTKSSSAVFKTSRVQIPNISTVNNSEICILLSKPYLACCQGLAFYLCVSALMMRRWNQSLLTFYQCVCLGHRGSGGVTRSNKIHWLIDDDASSLPTKT